MLHGACALPALLSQHQLTTAIIARLQMRDRNPAVLGSVHPTNQASACKGLTAEESANKLEGRKDALSFLIYSWGNRGMPRGSEPEWKPVSRICYRIIFPPKPPPNCRREKEGQRSPGCRNHIPDALNLL